MKCPFCQNLEDKVLESREIEDGSVIRRRRQCLSCLGRFTSYERLEERPVLVLKRDGRKEQFSSEKIRKGIARACEKRPVSAEKMDQMVVAIEREVHQKFGREVSTAKVGQLVMEKLQDVDKIAYIRFASVYRKYESPDEFVKEVNEISTCLPASGG